VSEGGGCQQCAGRAEAELCEAEGKTARPSRSPARWGSPPMLARLRALAVLQA